VIRCHLAGDAGNATTAAVRFTSSDGGNPAGFGASVRLLGLADVAAVIARAWLAEQTSLWDGVAREARIAAVYEETGRHLATATIPGFAPRDVRDLQDALESAFPEAPSLRTLSAAGYWNDLAEVSSHLPWSDRVKVLALLWDEQEEATQVLATLTGAIAEIGHVRDIYLPREAFLAAHPASGWAVRHPRSVLDVRTLAGLGEEGDERLQLVGRYGQKGVAGRATLAALAAEVVVPLPPAVLTGAPEADLVVFPDAAAPAIAGGEGARDRRGRADTLRAFAAAKARYLFDRARLDHQITALVVAVDPAGPPDDAMAAAVGDWIDDTHGATPEARERSPTRLFVVATRSDQGQEAYRRAEQLAVTRWGDRLDSAIADVVGGALDWPAEWVPGRPFANVYLFRHPAGGLDTVGLQRAGADPAQRRLTGGQMLAALLGLHRRPRHYVREPAAAERALAGGDGGAGLLAAALAQACHASAKLDQLRQSLGELDRCLKRRLRRLGVTVDVETEAHRRRRLAALIDHRIDRLQSSRGIGRLVEILLVHDEELVARWWRGGAPELAAADAVPQRRGGAAARRAPISAPSGADGRPADLARRALVQWEAGMLRAAGSHRLARSAGLDGPLLETLDDELAIGARRTDLEGSLARALAAGLESRPADGPERDCALFVSVASAVLNGWVERLDQGAALAATAGRPRSSWAATERQELLPSSTADGRRLETVWSEALGHLIDANTLYLAHARPAIPAAALAELVRLAALIRTDSQETEL
jgi:hypothetical protein